MLAILFKFYSYNKELFFPDVGWNSSSEGAAKEGQRCLNEVKLKANGRGLRTWNGAVNVGCHWRYDLYGKTKGLKCRIDSCCRKIFTAAQVQGIFSNFIKDPYIL